MTDVGSEVSDAVEWYWETLSDQADNQRDSDNTARGRRAQVLGGAQMDGFAGLIEDALVDTGLPRDDVLHDHDATLPGYFRATKRWDIAVRTIEADGTGRLVADIISSVAAEERRRLISRTESGQRRARKEGKWMTRPPKGFSVDDGYLNPIIDPDYDEGETGYWDMVEAIEALTAGKSYRSVAADTPNVTRQTLSSIMDDVERVNWYISQEAEDARVQEALAEVTP